MKLNKYSAIVVLVVTCVMTSISAPSAQDEDLVSLMDKIIDRIDSYPEMENWKAMVVTRQTFADKQWQPKDKSLTTKIMVTVMGDEVKQEILEITGTKNGMSKDLTQEFKKDQNAAPESDKFNNNTSKDQQEMDGSTFSKDNRTKYDFKKLDDSVIDGRPVYVIEAKVKKKDKSRLEGKYYIDQETFDILKFQGKPSKDLFPFVDVMEMEVQSEILPGGYFVQKRSKMRLSTGILGMHIRVIMEIEHSDYEILPPGNFGNGTTEVPDSEKDELTPDSKFND